MKEREQATRKNKLRNTQIYLENPKWEKPQVEEKKIHYVKNCYKKERVMSDYCIT